MVAVPNGSDVVRRTVDACNMLIPSENAQGTPPSMGQTYIEEFTQLLRVKCVNILWRLYLTLVYRQLAWFEKAGESTTGRPYLLVLKFWAEPKGTHGVNTNMQPQEGHALAEKARRIPETER